MNLAAPLLLLSFCCLPQEEQPPAAPVQQPYRELSAEERESFLKEMAAALKSIRSLRAVFVQERHLSLFVEPLRSRGVCSFERPGRLRWEVTEPYASLLILDGRGVAKFDRVEGRPRKLELGGADLLREVLGQITDWMRGDFSRAGESYRLKLERGEDYRLSLTPRSKELREMIHAVELSINPKTHRVTQVVIREPGQDDLSIRFEEERINLEFEPRTFDLERPRWK